MSNNIVLQRISTQAALEKQRREQQNAIASSKDIQKLSAAPPPPQALSVSELKEILESNTPQEVKINEGVAVFNSLENFCEWMIPNHSQFAPPEQEVLKKIIEMRDSIFKGCACKRAARRGMANDFFRGFIIENQNSQLIEQIKKIAQVGKIQFSQNNSLYLEK